MTKTVLIIGSGLNAPDAQEWDAGLFEARVVINNAWRIRPDWTHLIHPEDFPADRHPPEVGANQTIVTAQNYVPLQNRLGGFVYAGGTMAFTAGYWALLQLKPDVLGFIGCDMTYAATGNTHFYGTGAADPLRDDISLQSLEAKSARLMALAARAGCQTVNYSSASDSRLVFPRAVPGHRVEAAPVNRAAVRTALNREDELGYYVPSGRYWEIQNQFNAKALRELDEMWLGVLG